MEQLLLAGAHRGVSGSPVQPIPKPEVDESHAAGVRLQPSRLATGASATKRGPYIRAETPAGAEMVSSPDSGCRERRRTCYSLVSSIKDIVGESFIEDDADDQQT